jgi:hypothetical protein
MKTPNIKLRNKTKIAEREVFRHQPRRSLCLKKLLVKKIRKDCTLSRGEKRAFVGIAVGRIIMVDRRDYNIRVYSHAGRWYKMTLAGYLVDVSHQFGGPANSDTNKNKD